MPVVYVVAQTWQLHDFFLRDVIYLRAFSLWPCSSEFFLFSEFLLFSASWHSYEAEGGSVAQQTIPERRQHAAAAPPASTGAITL